jgi:hypothetical protein
MWILQFLKYAFNETFDFLLVKVRGRFASFIIQLVLSYLALAILTVIVTMVAVPLLNQGEMSMDVFSTQGMFQWAGMLDPIWIVTSVVCVNYFFRRSSAEQRMTFSDFYKGKSSGFWFDFSVAVAILAVVFIIFNRSSLFYSYSDNTPLDVLLTEGLENTAFSIQSVLSSWIFYLAYSSPVVALVIIEVRERKRNGVSLRTNILKVILVSVLMYFAVSWIVNNLLHIFQELILNIINSPFEMVEIPVFLGVTANIFFQTFQLMFFSVFVHFLIQHAFDKTHSVPLRDESNDLLDN